LVFPARPAGAAGHYVAEVRFPSAGNWLWEVDQSPFGPQKLGTLAVLPALAEPKTTAGTPQPRAATQPGSAELRFLLPVPAALATALSPLRLFPLLSRHRNGATHGETTSPALEPSR